MVIIKAWRREKKDIVKGYRVSSSRDLCHNNVNILNTTEMYN